MSETQEGPMGAEGRPSPSTDPKAFIAHADNSPDSLPSAKESHLRVHSTREEDDGTSPLFLSPDRHAESQTFDSAADSSDSENIPELQSDSKQTSVDSPAPSSLGARSGIGHRWHSSYGVLPSIPCTTPGNDPSSRGRPYSAASLQSTDLPPELISQSPVGLLTPRHSARMARKRALSLSPLSIDSSLDLGSIIRASPNSLLAYLNPSSTSRLSDSGSLGHLSPSLMSLQTPPLLQQQLPPLQSTYSPLFSLQSEQDAAIRPLSSSVRRHGSLEPVSEAPMLHQTCVSESKSASSASTAVTSPKGAQSSRGAEAAAGDGEVEDDEVGADQTIDLTCHWRGCQLPPWQTQAHLVTHVNSDHVHGQKKEFVCEWEGCQRQSKPFKAQYMLVVHMRRHTSEKPHKCTIEGCSKAYSRLENLKTHIRSHTGERPYMCEICCKSFTNASDRAKHQNRTHSNEKPYACKNADCTKRYTDPSSLRKHAKNCPQGANKRMRSESNQDVADADRAHHPSAAQSHNSSEKSRTTGSSSSDSGDSHRQVPAPRSLSGQGPNRAGRRLSDKTPQLEAVIETGPPALQRLPSQPAVVPDVTDYEDPNAGADRLEVGSDGGIPVGPPNCPPMVVDTNTGLTRLQPTLHLSTQPNHCRPAPPSSSQLHIRPLSSNTPFHQQQAPLRFCPPDYFPQRRAPPKSGNIISPDTFTSSNQFFPGSQQTGHDQLPNMQALAIQSPTYSAPPPPYTRQIDGQDGVQGFNQGFEDFALTGAADYLGDMSRRSSDASILTINDMLFNGSRRSSISSQTSGTDSRMSSLSNSGQFTFEQFRTTDCSVDGGRSRRSSNASQTSLPPLVGSSHSLPSGPLQTSALTQQAVLQWQLQSKLASQQPIGIATDGMPDVSKLDLHAMQRRSSDGLINTGQILRTDSALGRNYASRLSRRASDPAKLYHFGNMQPAINPFASTHPQAVVNPQLIAVRSASRSSPRPIAMQQQQPLSPQSDHMALSPLATASPRNDVMMVDNVSMMGSPAAIPQLEQQFVQHTNAGITMATGLANPPSNTAVHDLQTMMSNFLNEESSYQAAMATSQQLSSQMTPSSTLSSALY